MSKLNFSYIERIKKSLEHSLFTLNDFEIIHPNGRDGMLIEIKFLYAPQYSIMLFETISERKEITSHNNSLTMAAFGKSEVTKYVKQEVIQISMSPGEYKSTEKIDIYDIGDLIDYIPKWCRYIKEDIQANIPQVNPIEELRKKFNEEIDSLYDNPKAYFEESEISELDGKFEALYEKIAELQEDYSITQAQLQNVQKEFEEFKSSARIYPKGMWAKVTNNKLISIMSDLLNSKEGRELIFEQIKKLIQG